MIKFLRNMIEVVIESAVMPTGKNLVPTIGFASGIFVLNVIFRIIGFPVVLHWAGCLAAVLILLIILIIERSEYSAVSKLYRDAELRLKDLKARQQKISSSWKNARAVDSCEEH